MSLTETFEKNDFKIKDKRKVVLGEKRNKDVFWISVIMSFTSTTKDIKNRRKKDMKKENIKEERQIEKRERKTGKWKERKKEIFFIKDE